MDKLNPEILEGMEIEEAVLEEKLEKEIKRSDKQLIPILLQGQEPKEPEDYKKYKDKVRSIVRSNGLYLHGQE